MRGYWMRFGGRKRAPGTAVELIAIQVGGMPLGECCHGSKMTWTARAVVVIRLYFHLFSQLIPPLRSSQPCRVSHTTSENLLNHYNSAALAVHSRADVSALALRAY